MSVQFSILFTLSRKVNRKASASADLYGSTGGDSSATIDHRDTDTETVILKVGIKIQRSLY